MRQIEAYSYGCVMAELPKELADKVMAFSALIPDEDVFGDDEKGREDQIHVTVKYGLHTDDPKKVEEVVSGYPAVTIELGGMSVFHNEDNVVLKLDVRSPDLHQLNRVISKELKCTDSFHEYHPHVTVAYLKHRKDDPYWYRKLFTDMFEGEKFETKSLLFSTADDDDYQIPLTTAIAARVAGRNLVRTIEKGDTVVFKSPSGYKWEGEAEIPHDGGKSWSVLKNNRIWHVGKGGLEVLKVRKGSMSDRVAMRFASAKHMITDMGKKVKAVPTDGGKPLEIPRYGVWDRRTGNVVDTGNDLGKLLKKYDLPKESVFKMASSKVAIPHFLVECRGKETPVDMYIELYGTGKLDPKYERLLEKHFKTTDRREMVNKAMRQKVIPVQCPHGELELVDKDSGEMIKRVR